MNLAEYIDRVNNYKDDPKRRDILEDVLTDLFSDIPHFVSHNSRRVYFRLEEGTFYLYIGSDDGFHGSGYPVLRDFFPRRPSQQELADAQNAYEVAKAQYEGMRGIFEGSNSVDNVLGGYRSR